MRSALASCVVFVAACAGGNISVKASAGTDAPAKTADTRAPVAEAPPPPPPARKISFTRKGLAPGMGWLEKSAFGANVLAQANLNGVHVAADSLFWEEEELREEVVATDGKAVQKLKVSFGPMSQVSYVNGALRKPKRTFAGKAYVIEARPDGVLFITTDKGTKVTKQEGDMLARRYLRFFHDQPLAKGPEGAIEVGSHVDALLPFVSHALLGHDSDAVVHDLSVRLVGTREDQGGLVGVFALRGEQTIRVDHGLVRVLLEGELAVRTGDGMPVSMALAGPIAAGADPRVLRVGSDGNMRWRSTWSPL
jgi:hypothetical protein